MRDFGLVPSFACLMLAACVSIRASSPEQGAVSLTGMQTRAYPPIEHGAWGTLPAELQAALTKLPESVAPLDRPALTALARLRYARSAQREFYARSDDVTVWMRRFEGKDGGPAGLALQVAGSCNRLPPVHLLSRTDLDALTSSCAQREHADFDTGLLLFKLASDGRLLPAGEVQGQLFPRLSAAQQHTLDSIGVGPPFADIPMLADGDEMAVGREAEPERPLPENLPGTHPVYPGLVHGGNLVWTGTAFRIRQP